MAAKMKYPVGIQDFAEVVERGFSYIDKTSYIRKLLDMGKYYFLSRPRRFGKSLFISTLEKYFEGKRALFMGLDIDTDDMDWTPRPVIKFSFNSIRVTEKNNIDKHLETILSRYEVDFGVNNIVGDYSDRFENILRTAYKKTGEKAVVLVDEYDAPIINTLEYEELNTYYRETLKSIFTILKNADEYIHFAFVTGVSRFSHTSLFSGANNLKDISLLPEFSAICGITEDELKGALQPGVQDFADSLEVSYQEMLAILKKNYDGYHFSEVSPDIYNPFSLLNALQSRRIDNYWFESGTPTSFLKALKRDNFYLPNLECIETTSGGLSGRESFLRNPVTLLYEAGYLTIKDYDDELKAYVLSLPNEEVAVSFSEALLPIYSEYETNECIDSLNNIRRAVIKGEPGKFMQHLQTFLAGNPYGLTELAKRETYFENNIYLVFRALGFMPRSEEQTCRSRMDIMLRTRRFIYIFELKTDGSVEEATDQIEEKGYALPYLDEGKTIIKIAANYSSKTNNIDSWKIQEESL